MNREIPIHNHKKLSIQLSSGGFSFCIYDNQTQQYEHLTHISFALKITTPAIMLEEVKKVFKTNELLHNTYEEVFLIHHNELSTFVPKSYFDESLLHTYLQHTVKIFENDYVSYDEVNSPEVNNVYIPFVNINNYFFDSFGAFTYLHSSTVFLQNIVRENPSTDKKMFVNVYADNYQLLVLENGQLLLSNYFDYSSKEDFVYYILFVAEQLKMDTNIFELILYGNINEKDDIYQLLYNYIRYVKIYATLHPKLGENINTMPQKHYNLLQLHL